MKRTHVPVMMALLATMALGGCEKVDPPSVDLAAVREVIEAKNRQFTQAHVTGEVEAINAYFTADAKIFLPNAELVTGRDDIAALNAEYVGYGIAEFSEETTALYGGGDYLVEEGRYSMVYGADRTLEYGKYINIWRQEGGDWKVCSNIWNSDLPAGP